MSELVMAKLFVVCSVLFLSWTLVACTTTVTTTEYPDGRKVTEKTTGIDPSAAPIAHEAAYVAHDIIRDK